MLIQQNSNNNLNFKSILKTSKKLKLPGFERYFDERWGIEVGGYFEKYLARDGKNWIVELKEDVFQHTTPQMFEDNLLSKIIKNFRSIYGYSSDIKEVCSHIMPCFNSSKTREELIENLINSNFVEDIEIGWHAVKYHSNKEELITNEIIQNADGHLGLFSPKYAIRNFSEVKDPQKRLDIINRIARQQAFETTSYDLKMGLAYNKTLTDEERIIVIRDLIDDGGIWNAYMDARGLETHHIGAAIALLKDKNIANQMLQEVEKSSRWKYPLDEKDIKENIRKAYIKYSECSEEVNEQNISHDKITLSIYDTSRKKLGEYSERININDNVTPLLEYMYKTLVYLMKQ